MNARLFSLVAVSFLFSSSAFAVCYDEVYVPEVVNCSKDGTSNFADFSGGGCSFTPARVDTVEVECPGRWVQTNGDKSHAQACSSVGLSTATHATGAICVSGESRNGGQSEGISFVFGRWGGDGGIGKQVTTTSFSSGGLGSRDDNGQKEYVTRYYCWQSGQKKDYDGTDIAVGFYCK